MVEKQAEWSTKRPSRSNNKGQAVKPGVKLTGQFDQGLALPFVVHSAVAVAGGQKAVVVAARVLSVKSVEPIHPLPQSARERERERKGGRESMRE